MNISEFNGHSFNQNELSISPRKISWPCDLLGDAFVVYLSLLAQNSGDLKYGHNKDHQAEDRPFLQNHLKCII
jgi:hypothetical protein